MKISIVYLTYRPGGFDMLADSLSNQTIQDYELIIIDDYAVDRRRIVKRYLEDNGVNVGYIGKSKEKCFPDTVHNFVNALNTGIMASTGDVILLVQDYSCLRPDSLERWMRHEALFEDDYCIAGAGKYWKKEPEGVEKDFTHPTSIWKEDWSGSPEENGWTEYAMWVGCPFELFYAAIPYNVFLETNGFQEWNDYIHVGYLHLTSFVTEVEKIGGKLIEDNTNVCEMINHRIWEPQSLWYGLAKNPQYGAVYPYTNLSKKDKEAITQAAMKAGSAKIPAWWISMYKDGKSYSHPTDFPEYKTRNCFDLKKHVRGTVV